MLSGPPAAAPCRGIDGGIGRRAEVFHGPNLAAQPFDSVTDGGASGVPTPVRRTPYTALTWRPWPVEVRAPALLAMRCPSTVLP